MLLVWLGTSFTGRAQTTISLVGDDVVLKFPTASNMFYSVQRADVLASNAWSIIISNIVGSGGVRTSIDSGAATVASRFYRVGSFNPSTNGGTVVVLVEFTGGAPVQDALVVLSYSGTGQYGYTDNNGQIIFANVPAGSFGVQAYSPSGDGAFANGSGSISRTGALATTSVIMPGTGSVEAFVYYASGEPAVSANMIVVSGTTTNGPVSTGPAAHLTIEGIPLGSFTVTAYNPTNMNSFASASGNLATNGASATLYLNLP